jgi:tetratricopeptide (TPR) repeat protein
VLQDDGTDEHAEEELAHELLPPPRLALRWSCRSLTLERARETISAARRNAVMAAGHDERYDFFLSRRGSVAAVAREVADALNEKGYKVLVQDYDIPLGASFVEAMHEAVKNSRDLVILFTRDYEQSPYTRKEFTSFEAERHQSAEERYVIVLRCEDVPLRGLLADNVYQDLVGVTDPQERKRRIIAAAERQSQAARPPPRPFIGVPLRIASFTGRAEELDRLDAILMRKKSAALTQWVGRAAVQGLGGVGKTSVATEYAHRYRQLYAGVCWCPAETRAGLMTSLAGLAVTLGATTADEADVENGARTALRCVSEQRAAWLLVYDNVTSPDQIDDLLPSGDARALITSRFADWSAVAEEVSLNVLPLDEAAACLHRRTGRKDAEGARTLAEAVGCLPLALDHAAAYCKRTQMPFSQYAAKVSSLIAAAPRGVNYPRSVAATFELAISETVSQCPLAEQLVAFLAYCAPERIPLLLIEGALADEAERQQALAALAELSLATHDAFDDGTAAVTIHRLVQAVARSRAETNGTSQAALERLIRQIAIRYPVDGYDNPAVWPLCAKLNPHLLVQQDPWPDLLNRAGDYFHARASYKEAASLFQQVLSIRERSLGPEHPQTATSLDNLAILVRDQGDFAGARQLFERALAIREKARGLGHPDTATTLNHLGVVLHAEGDLVGAQPLLERAQAIFEKVFGPTHPSTASNLSALADLLCDQGELVRARSLYERALSMQERALGSDHLLTAATLSGFAQLLQAQGDVSAAQPMFERALAIREKALGSEHPRTNRLRHHLAKLLIATGRPAEALQLSETALIAQDKVLGSDHRHTKDSARVTADALDALGRSDEASVLREKYGLQASH